MCNETNKIKHKFIFEKCIAGFIFFSAILILLSAMLNKKEDVAPVPVPNKEIKCEYRDDNGVYNTITVKVPKDTALTNDVLCRAVFHAFIKKDTTTK